MADLHVHTLTVRAHRVSCDSPVLVQHGMGHDAIALDLDAEWDGLSARLVLGPCGSAYDVLYVGGRLTDEERENLYELARTKADPDDSLPDVTERVGAIEERVAEPEDEYPAYKKPTCAEDAYYTGMKMTYTDGKRYECIAPEDYGCTYGPDVLPNMWREVTD